MVGPELAAALVAAQAEFSAIPKNSDNPFFKSKYADLATVVAVTSPILAKHGLGLSQFPSGTQEHPALTTYLIHSSGQFVACEMPLYLPKNDPQGQGSALTYARRYAYMAVLGLVADEDDDGNAASPKIAVHRIGGGGTGEGPAPLVKAKNKLRDAVKASGADALEYAWVQNATIADVPKILGLAEALSSGKVTATS